MKRRLLPGERQELAEKLRGKSAFALRNEMAAALQSENLPERADLPSLNALNLIKSRNQCPEQNVFEALDALKDVHVNCIHKIGYDPFFVIYETPAQTEYYAKEKQRRRRIISIDATGPGLRSPTSNPKSIFLYNICAQGNFRLQ